MILCVKACYIISLTQVLKLACIHTHVSFCRREKGEGQHTRHTGLSDYLLHLPGVVNVKNSVLLVKLPSRTVMEAMWNPGGKLTTLIIPSSSPTHVMELEL